MTPLAFSIAVSAAFVLAGAAVSLVTLWRASALFRSAASPPASAVPDPAVDLLQARLAAVEAELRDLRQQPPSPSAPHATRAAMNLDRRSQALRMHRRGDSPVQIAVALDLPLQEIDLLLKVHRIVLRTI